MPGGPCLSEVFQPLPGACLRAEPALRLRGLVLTVLRLMLEDDALLPSAELTPAALDACQPEITFQN